MDTARFGIGNRPISQQETRYRIPRAQTAPVRDGRRKAAARQMWIWRVCSRHFPSSKAFNKVFLCKRPSTKARISIKLICAFNCIVNVKQTHSYYETTKILE